MTLRRVTIDVECPAGWEPVAHRTVQEGEYYLAAENEELVVLQMPAGTYHSRRLIVRRSDKYAPAEEGDKTR